MHTAKLAQLESSKASSLWRDAAVVLLSSFLIGLFAKLAIPLPFTPVPIGTQNFVVLFLAALLGPRKGAAAVFAFLAQGALGWPVFAGGVGGAAKLLGPTGGYLIGYLVAAYVTGALVEKAKEATAAKIFWALSAGAAVIYAFGASYLALFVGIEKAFLLGVAPFLLGDAFKAVFCVKILNWVSGLNKRA